MEDRKIVRARRAAYLSVACAGLLLLSGCTAPVHVAWNRKQSVIEPRVPPPQGELDVYSESYVFYDGNVPRIHRRPVEVYSVDGRLIVSARAQDGEGPIRFDLTPGHYIVTAESHMQLRRVEVDVQDGQDTVVTAAQFADAPLLASTQTAGPQH
jgi:hypothetical protein